MYKGIWTSDMIDLFDTVCKYADVEDPGTFLCVLQNMLTGEPEKWPRSDIDRYLKALAEQNWDIPSYYELLHKPLARALRNGHFEVVDFRIRCWCSDFDDLVWTYLKVLNCNPKVQEVTDKFVAFVIQKGFTSSQIRKTFGGLIFKDLMGLHIIGKPHK